MFWECILGRKRKEKVKSIRIQVSFTEDQWRLIERFKGVMGNDAAEIVRNIIISWLAEKSIIASIIKKEAK